MVIDVTVAYLHAAMDQENFWTMNSKFVSVLKKLDSNFSQLKKRLINGSLIKSTLWLSSIG